MIQWMNLKDIMPSEIDQPQKGKSRVILLFVAVQLLSHVWLFVTP